MLKSNQIKERELLSTKITHYRKKDKYRKKSRIRIKKSPF